MVKLYRYCTVAVVCGLLRLPNSLSIAVCILYSGNGRSTVVCDKAFIVPRDSVTLAYPLAVDETVTCSGAYSLTVQDIDNLERITIGTVTAKDEYSYEVGASDTETVALSQVSANAVNKITKSSPAFFRVRIVNAPHVRRWRLPVLSSLI